MTAEPGTVRTAARALAIVDLIAAQGPLKLTDVAAALRLPRSSAHGLLHTLATAGYLERRDDQTYGLGLRLWQLAQSFDEIERLRRLVKPVMDELVASTEETVQLARLDGIDALYLEISLSPHPMKLASAIGERVTAHASAIGKVLLAELDPEEARARLSGAELPQFTPNTICELEPLLAELDRTRSRGYGLDNEEALLGLRCIAMPIRDRRGETVAALSVSIPTPRFSRAIAARVRERLAEAAADAGRRIG